MKCLILAGGRGERLWPLSRKNYPKQFIRIRKNHSTFQETVARNIPYCDEFIIVTSYEYRYIIESQMTVFQGVTYRCIYEEVPCKTAAAIELACMDLQSAELVFVVAADHLINTATAPSQSGLGYKDAILAAKQKAAQGNLVVFGLHAEEVNQRFGWICHKGDQVIRFVEKPDEKQAAMMTNQNSVLQNAGLMLCKNGILQKELSTNAPEFFKQCIAVYKRRTVEGNKTIYRENVLKNLPAIFLEKILLEKTDHLKVVECGFGWTDIGKLEDLSAVDYRDEGLCVKQRSENTTVINNTPNQVILVNDVDDLMVVSTPDAVYIGKQGESDQLKSILKKHEELHPYTEHGTTFYRSWGYYQQLFGEAKYRIRRVVLYPGKTIYAHSHQMRSENWTIVQGQVSITLNGTQKIYHAPENVDIAIGVVHQISNVGSEEAVFVETACGEILHEQDMISKPTRDLSENQLGMDVEPFVKLSPAFKDYLWGGTRLRDDYDKKCDYDIIAESWELSAHPDGQSIVASGRHKGLPFGVYLEVVGKEVLGWKCQSMIDFPLMVKFIDAKGDLSIQVHPDDDYALEHEHQYGKNEMWYILDCEPGSSLYMGFNRDVSREEVERRVRDNTIMEVLNRVPTHPGDVFFIPAGTVHAIGAGNLICEIQQSSNCTYRLYDYDRKDKYGNRRELHIEKALCVLNCKKYNWQKSEEEFKDRSVVSRCKYFEMAVYDVKSVLPITVDESRFLSVVCVEGKGSIYCNGVKETLKRGDSIFVKAQDDKVYIEGMMKVIISHI
jgi:mannose-1-phosphate guanylyltransferase/mannose-6-phosphate isomerase